MEEEQKPKICLSGDVKSDIATEEEGKQFLVELQELMVAYAISHVTVSWAYGTDFDALEKATTIKFQPEQEEQEEVTEAQEPIRPRTVAIAPPQDIAQNRPFRAVRGNQTQEEPQDRAEGKQKSALEVLEGVIPQIDATERAPEMGISQEPPKTEPIGCLNCVHLEYVSEHEDFSHEDVAMCSARDGVSNLLGFPWRELKTVCEGREPRREPLPPGRHVCRKHKEAFCDCLESNCCSVNTHGCSPQNHAFFGLNSANSPNNPSR